MARAWGGDDATARCSATRRDAPNWRPGDRIALVRQAQQQQMPRTRFGTPPPGVALEDRLFQISIYTVSSIDQRLKLKRHTILRIGRPLSNFWSNRVEIFLYNSSIPL